MFPAARRWFYGKRGAFLWWKITWRKIRKKCEWSAVSQSLKVVPLTASSCHLVGLHQQVSSFSVAGDDLITEPFSYRLAHRSNKTCCSFKLFIYHLIIKMTFQLFFNSKRSSMHFIAQSRVCPLAGSPCLLIFALRVSLSNLFNWGVKGKNPVYMVSFHWKDWMPGANCCSWWSSSYVTHWKRFQIPVWAD